MRDGECTAFLQWALPRLRMRWRGFRKVRGQVCKRIRRRAAELGLQGCAGYRVFLEAHPEEWEILDSLCRVTISRFYRDRGVFDWLRRHAHPRSAWSAGCASGEEAYTLRLLFPDCAIVATDADERLLARARAGRFSASSLKDLPPDLRERSFERDGDRWVVAPALAQSIEWRCADLRATMPEGPFDLICCRYLAFTYFEPALQAGILAGLRARLAPRGLLVVGTHETLPPSDLERIAPCVFRHARKDDL